MLKLIPKLYRKLENTFRPWLFKRHAKALIKRYPQVEPFVKAYQLMYFETKYSAHDYSLLERLKKKITNDLRFIYGSTPWPTLLKVLQVVKIKETDHFVELGCGTGHLCFLINYLHTIPVTGIELLEVFIQKAQQLKEHLKLGKDVNFINQDLLKTDLSQGTVFFVTNTCFPVELREEIAFKLSQINHPITIIAITFPLESEHFEIVTNLRGWFSWGYDKIWIQQSKMISQPD